MPTTAELLMNLQGLDYQLAELERSKDYLPDMISTLEGEIKGARAAVDEALAAKATGEKKVILFNLSGHGHFDMSAYDAYLAGQLADNEFSVEDMVKSLATVPQVG